MVYRSAWKIRSKILPESGTFDVLFLSRFFYAGQAGWGEHFADLLPPDLGRLHPQSEQPLLSNRPHRETPPDGRRTPSATRTPFAGPLKMPGGPELPASCLL